jgi:hypothetical protein
MRGAEARTIPFFATNTTKKLQQAQREARQAKEEKAEE